MRVSEGFIGTLLDRNSRQMAYNVEDCEVVDFGRNIIKIGTYIHGERLQRSDLQRILT